MKAYATIGDNHRQPMKYYIYVSESKIEMLYAQIPRKPSFKWPFNLKLKFRSDDNSSIEKQLSDTLYSKLNAVESYIEKHMGVGSIDAPKEYFYGNAQMRWTQLHPGVLFFGGVSGNTMIGLGGSLKHLLGYHVGNVEPGISHTPWLVSLLIKELDLQINEPSLSDVSINEEQNRILSSINYWSNELSKTAEAKFQFLARKLLSADYYGKKVLLGTPIYVAWL